MVKLKIIPYTIRIKDKKNSKRNNHIYLNLVDMDFIKHFKQFINNSKKLIKDVGKEKIFDSEDLKFDDKNDTYYGCLGSGNYGYTAPIVNVNSGKKVKTKQKDESEKKRFYYILKVMGEKAILMINKHKTEGVKHQFHKELRDYLDSIGFSKDNYDLQIDPRVSKNLNKVKNIHKINFIKTLTPKDTESKTRKLLETDEEDIYTETRTIQLKGSNFKSVKTLGKKILKNLEEKNYVEVQDTQYTKVQFHAKMEDGSSKSITLTNKIKYYESYLAIFKGDFPDDETFYKKAKPYFEYVVKNS